MRIRVNEPDLADDLVEFLGRCECTVERVGRDVLSVDYAGLGRPETALSLLRKGLCYRCGEEVGAMLGRLGSPEDVVGAAIFLASEESKFLTGQMIMVNGGVVM